MSIQIKTIAVTGEKQTEIMNLTTPDLRNGEALIKVHAVAPVSSTHLDVYKRQGLSCVYLYIIALQSGGIFICQRRRALSRLLCGRSSS